MLTKAQVIRRLRKQTFLTSKERQEYVEQKKKQEKIEGAKKQNKTLQMFDKLLGMQEDPEVQEMRNIFPLYNMETPDMLKTNLGPNHEANL